MRAAGSAHQAQFERRSGGRSAPVRGEAARAAPVGRRSPLRGYMIARSTVPGASAHLRWRVCDASPGVSAESSSRASEKDAGRDALSYGASMRRTPAGRRTGARARREREARRRGGRATAHRVAASKSGSRHRRVRAEDRGRGAGGAALPGGGARGGARARLPHPPTGPPRLHVGATAHDKAAPDPTRMSSEPQLKHAPRPLRASSRERTSGYADRIMVTTCLAGASEAHVHRRSLPEDCRRRSPSSSRRSTLLVPHECRRREPFRRRPAWRRAARRASGHGRALMPLIAGAPSSSQVVPPPLRADARPREVRFSTLDQIDRAWIARRRFPTRPLDHRPTSTRSPCVVDGFRTRSRDASSRRRCRRLRLGRSGDTPQGRARGLEGVLRWS